MEVVVAIKMNVCYCAACSVPFGILPDFETRRRNDHKTFYCPAGHPNGYSTESEEERLRKKLHAETLARERAEREKREAQEAKEKTERSMKRHKTRAANGTCPCCNRTFKQLAAHMKNKHPEYAK